MRIWSNDQTNFFVEVGTQINGVHKMEFMLDYFSFEVSTKSLSCSFFQEQTNGAKKNWSLGGTLLMT